jgi:hypothetical protein
MARVKPREGAVPSEQELEAFCRERVGTFKVPRYWKFVDGFQMTVTGKIQKFRMRELAIDEPQLGAGSFDRHRLSQPSGPVCWRHRPSPCAYQILWEHQRSASTHPRTITQASVASRSCTRCSAHAPAGLAPDHDHRVRLDMLDRRVALTLRRCENPEQARPAWPGK